MELLSERKEVNAFYGRIKVGFRSTDTGVEGRKKRFQGHVGCWSINEQTIILFRGREKRVHQLYKVVV